MWKLPHKVPMFVQGTGVCSAMSHHGAGSNRGHSRTGQNSLLAPTGALLKAAPYQFPFGVLSAENWSCFYGSNARKAFPQINIYKKPPCLGNKWALALEILLHQWHPCVLPGSIKTFSVGNMEQFALGWEHMPSDTPFLSVWFFPAVFTLHRAGQPFPLPNPSIPFSLRAYLGCQWTQRCSRHVLSPISSSSCHALDVFLWHKRRPHWITAQYFIHQPFLQHCSS